MVQTEQKPQPTIVEKEMESEESPLSDDTSEQVIKPIRNSLTFKNVHFDFDKYEVRPEAKEILTQHAQVLKENPALHILIEGHCDEWGSAEYNMVLGEHRAKAAKGFLVACGIAEHRISTVSYGKERPEDRGHNKEAWARNRRAAFVVLDEHKNIAMP